MTPEEIQAALSVKCDMCKAEIGCECTSIIDGKPLRDTDAARPCHYYRKAS